MKKVLALALASAMTLSLVGCNNADSTPSDPNPNNSVSGEANPTSGLNSAAAGDGVFRIGVYNYIAGVPLATEQEPAFQVAMDKYGNQVNGEPIEIVVYDTQNDPTEAVTGVQWLIGQNCDAVIGSFQSSDTVAAYPYLEEAGIFNIMPCTSGSMVTDDQIYSFRGAFNANVTADSYAQVCVDMGYSNVAVFYGQDEASISNWEAVEPAFQSAGLNIVTVQTGTQSDTDYSAQCMQIVNAKPDVVYVVCQNAGQNFIKQLREYGYNGIIMNKDEWMTSHVSAIGEENSHYIMSEVAYTTYTSMEAAAAAGASDNVIEFLEAYQEKTGSLPTIGITYRMYDSMLIILETATRAGAGCDGKAMADACLTINDLQACMGTVDFTQGDREPAHEFTAIIYDDGGSKPFADWLVNGSYDAFKTATGREK